CHDHKFDPLTQADYYALYGFFQSTRYPWPGIELDKVQRDLVPLVSPAQVQAEEVGRRATLDAAQADVRQRTAEKAALENKRDELKKTGDDKELVDFLTKEIKEAAEAIKVAKTQLEGLEKKPLPYPTAYAVADRPAAGKRKAGNACIQIK